MSVLHLDHHWSGPAIFRRGIRPAHYISSQAGVRVSSRQLCHRGNIGDGERRWETPATDRALLNGRNRTGTESENVVDARNAFLNLGRHRRSRNTPAAAISVTLGRPRQPYRRRPVPGGKRTGRCSAATAFSMIDVVGKQNSERLALQDLRLRRRCALRFPSPDWSAISAPGRVGARFRARQGLPAPAARQNSWRMLMETAYMTDRNVIGDTPRRPGRTPIRGRPRATSTTWRFDNPFMRCSCVRTMPRTPCCVGGDPPQRKRRRGTGGATVRTSPPMA